MPKKKGTEDYTRAVEKMGCIHPLNASVNPTSKNTCNLLLKKSNFCKQ
jgi:hypothetical protein